jgi:hypothetical protein
MTNQRRKQTVNKLTEEDLVFYDLKEKLKKKLDKEILKSDLPDNWVVEMLEELINLYKN